MREDGARASAHASAETRVGRIGARQDVGEQIEDLVAVEDVDEAGRHRRERVQTALLDRARFDPASDQLWFVGDVVNRGPDSLKVLRFIRSLGSRATVVLGNHDLHLLAVAEGVRALRGADTLRPILEAPDREELMDWLRQRPLICR